MLARQFRLYTVAAHDSTTGIAGRFGLGAIATRDLAAWNPDQPAVYNMDGTVWLTEMREDQALVIPPGWPFRRVAGLAGSGVVGESEATFHPEGWDFTKCTYTIQSGDVPFQLAQLYGVTVSDINKLNIQKWSGDPAKWGAVPGNVVQMPDKACNRAKVLFQSLPPKTSCSPDEVIVGGVCIPKGAVPGPNGQCPPGYTNINGACVDSTKIPPGTTPGGGGGTFNPPPNANVVSQKSNAGMWVLGGLAALGLATAAVFAVKDQKRRRGGLAHA